METKLAVSEGNMVQEGWGSEISLHWLGRHVHHLAGARERGEGTKGIITESPTFCFFFFNSYIEMELIKTKCHMIHSFNMHNSRVFMHSQILVTSIVNFGIFSSLPN